MLLLSSRKHRHSNNKTSPAMLAYQMPTGPDSTVDGVTLAKVSSVFESLRGKRVLMLVHGYKNTIGHVQDAYRILEEQKAAHLDEHYDVVLGYTWPSVRSVVHWRRAKRNASKINAAFYHFIDRLDAKSLDVMTHSLGANVVLSALKRAKPLALRKPIRHLYLTAPAIRSRSCVPGGGQYYSSTQCCETVVVMYSHEDEVLKTAFPVAERRSALGLRGPRGPLASNVYSVDCSAYVRTHGAYKRTEKVFTYIHQHMTGIRVEHSKLK